MKNVAIIEALARRRAVENICDRVTERPGSADSRDLAQHVYEILLLKTTDLTGIENIDAFVSQIVRKQWGSAHSAFYRGYRTYGKKAKDIDETRVVETLPDGP